MLKENILKSKIDRCPFKVPALNELYKKICSLDAPYIWSEAICEGEDRNSMPKLKLYYIADMVTATGVVSGYGYYGGWELPDRVEDILTLHLVRSVNNEESWSTREIKVSLDSKYKNLSLEDIMQRWSLHFPTSEELSEAQYVDGLPSISVYIPKPKPLTEDEIAEYKRQLLVLKTENKVYADWIKDLTYKTEHNNKRIADKEDILSKGVKPLSYRERIG